MNIVKALQELSLKNQVKFLIIFAFSMIILAVPLLFVDITTDIYLYFISGLITSMMLCFKSTGLLKSIPESVRNIISIFIFIAVPVVNTIFVAPASNRNYVVMNLFIISIVCFILFLIIRNSAVTSVITTLLCFSLYTLNDVLIAIRGNILTLSDFSAFRTALTVASNYSYEITENVYYSFLCTVALVVCSVVFPYIPKKVNSIRVKTRVYEFVCIWTIFSSILFLKEFDEYSTIYNWYNQYTFNERGICYNLVMNIKERIHTPPENYSVKAVNDILERYDVKEESRNPNIIIIMNEAYSDLSLFTEINPSEDPTPFINSLDENVTKGYTVVSSIGGKTCNSEFEYLTGLSMAFLPHDTYPYLQYIRDDTQTIISDLDSDIYNKIYMHPYIASNYKRSSVFTFLGFDEFYDGLKFSDQKYYKEQIENMEGAVYYEGVDLIRGYIGDGVTYDKAIELFENKPEGERTVQFIVTMQNHWPYDYKGEDFENTISSGTGIYDFDQYLSLVKISDNEIKRLIEYFSDTEEDTVIVFFGDHIPGMDSLIEKNNISSGFVPEVDETLSKYSTPFFIWTNFDTETEDAGFVSLNYLSLLTKKKAGVELTQFDMFRDEMYQKYPVFSPNIIIDNEGNICYNKEEIDDEIISEYEKLQYYYLFDK
ncbi:MAG: sulfatase-like hydrolase/transferase [Oscillospiraceae bacterium]|nr:sulfatase-like hydrolase/transferase [Oscillospiraceae bacterium]